MSADPEPKPQENALETLFYRVEQVQFVYWGRFSGAKATIGLLGFIAALTFISGLSVLSQEEVTFDGPLALFFPEIIEIARFGGVLLAFVLALVVYGLQKRKRIAWYGAICTLPFIGILPLITLESIHMPVLLLAGIAYPLLILNRSQFNRSLDLSALQIAALASIGGVLAYGTIGSFAIREQFEGITTWTDSIYFVLVTIATVGYGDITPLTAEAKWFSLSVIIFGVAAFTTAIGALIVPAIEKRMASAFGNMTPSSLALLEDHIVILGYSEITDAVITELTDAAELVVVTTDNSVATALDEQNVNVLTADPTNIESLQNVGIEYARGAVAGTDDDARDVLAILAARKANPSIRIVAAANEAHNEEKFRDVGADHVISPTVIGGKLLGQAILEGSTGETSPKSSEKSGAQSPTDDS